MSPQTPALVIVPALLPVLDKALEHPKISEPHTMFPAVRVPTNPPARTLVSRKAFPRAKVITKDLAHQFLSLIMLEQVRVPAPLPVHQLAKEHLQVLVVVHLVRKVTMLVMDGIRHNLMEHLTLLQAPIR